MIKKHGNLTLNYKNDKLLGASSYDTCVLALRLDGVYVLNRTKYSSTTSKQISRYILPALKNFNYVEVKDLSKNVTESGLILASKTQNLEE